MEAHDTVTLPSTKTFVGRFNFERVCIGALLLIFVWATWRGIFMFYSDDDMMNMYWAWTTNFSNLLKAQFMPWIPLYRPLGALIYRILYANFGFNPLPLYILSWVLLLVNVIAAYPFFRALELEKLAAPVALAVTLIHGSFRDLYTNAGTIYDRLWFLCTALGLALYARMRRERSSLSFSAAAVAYLFSVLAMDSKESGMVLPVLLGCYECIFVLPEVWRDKRMRHWIRTVAPLYIVLAGLCLVHVFARVERTPELVGNPGYHPHASLSIWLAHVADYFSMLAYKHVAFTPLSAAALLVVAISLAGLLRNRAMIFGWLFFVISITPVALIVPKPGYILYVPNLGWGLYFGAAFSHAIRRLFSGAKREIAFIRVSVVVILVLVMGFHAWNWPQLYGLGYSPERGLTGYVRREYPVLPKGSRVLFVSDYFDKNGWIPLFNLRLLYRDRSLVVHRMEATAPQQPDRTRPLVYDHVFLAEYGQYVELDNSNIDESIRLHILRDFAAGRELDFGRLDHGAYVVSGVLDNDSREPGRWTTSQGKLKFDLYPANATFSVKFWVPDVVAAASVRTLSVLVNGAAVGSVGLTHRGTNENSFPVLARFISRNGYTIVDLNLDRPYKTENGDEFGIMLMRAGFDYSDWPKTHPDAPRSFDRTPVPPGDYDDSSEWIAEQGAWASGHYSDAFGGTLTYSHVIGDSMTLFFNGAGIEYWYTRAFNRGLAQVLIDGQEKARIDLYAPRILWRQRTVFRGLGPRPHTIEIRVLKEKNSRSSDYYVDVDKLVVRP